MFWICAEREVLITNEQCLHRAKVFSASHSTPPASGLGVHEKVGGDAAGTADPNWPKWYSMLYDIMLSIESWGRKKEGGGFWLDGFCLPE